MADRQHQWVKHTVVPVDVVSDPDNPTGFYAVIDESKLNQAELTAVFGCAACSSPLLTDTVGTPCSGSDPAIDEGMGS